MSKQKKLTAKTFDLTDVRAGNVDVPQAGGEMFATIRKQVKMFLPVGQAMLVTDVFPLIDALHNLKGSKRYNYLINACKVDLAFEFVLVNGRKFIGRKQ